MGTPNWGTKKTWLFSVYRGWNPTQLYVGITYNTPWNKDPVINQPGWLMESIRGAPFSWLNCPLFSPSFRYQQSAGLGLIGAARLPSASDQVRGRWMICETDGVDGWNPAWKPVEVGSLSHYLQGFVHPRWLFEISAINSLTLRVFDGETRGNADVSPKNSFGNTPPQMIRSPPDLFHIGVSPGFGDLIQGLASGQSCYPPHKSTEKCSHHPFMNGLESLNLIRSEGIQIEIANPNVIWSL